MNSDVLKKVINELVKLPAIGPKSAERIAFHLLRKGPEEVEALLNAIRELKTKLRYCSICFNLTDIDPCRICSNPKRDKSTICVVEEPKDLVLIEDAGVYEGVYHVLLGRISPVERIEAKDLTINHLIERAKKGVNEIILATNPTVEGDGTALYIAELIKKEVPDIKITRPARGLAVGSQLEFTSKATLASAIKERRPL